MSWTNDEWDSFCLLMEEAFPGEFPQAARTAYRLLLDDVEPAKAVRGLRGLLRTSRFRPSVAEIVQALERDHRAPTFDEAFHVLFESPRSPLKAASTQEAVDQAMRFHPLIARFVQVMGRDHLAQLQVFDPEWGGLRRAELRTTYDEIREAAQGRDVAAMVVGAGERSGVLKRLDPLVAIGGGARVRGELEAGEAA